MTDGFRVSISREIGFSSAHLYRSQHFDEATNQRIFGACFSPHGHGHNYKFRVTLSGPVHPDSLALLPSREFTDLLKETVQPLDHHHLNFAVEEFAGQGSPVPTTENIAKYLQNRLATKMQKRSEHFSGISLSSLELWEYENLAVRLQPREKPGPPKTTAEVDFRALHRLHKHDWSETENLFWYDNCREKHGHFYRLQATLAGEADASTGTIYDRRLFERILKTSIHDRFDGCDLTEHFPSTTGEYLARALFLRLQSVFPPDVLRRVRLQPAHRVYFAFPAEDSPLAGAAAGVSS